MRYHSIILITLICTAFSLNHASAQNPLDGSVILADTIPKLQSKLAVTSAKPEKRFGRASIQFGLAELVPWTFDRYVTQVDWAKISWKTVGRNIKPSSWTWDNDPFQTNQFGHPYHGSLFYSSFRTNGYNFWQSAPAAVVGSYLWETFAETQEPAPNDFINTSFGGIVLGEMTYRLSNKLVNNRSRGFKRQVSEVAGLIMNPMNGLTRILDGKWGRVSHSSGNSDSSIVTAEFDLGARRFGAGNTSLIKQGQFGWYGHVKLIYGVPNKDYRTPFSNIYINAEFGRDDSSMVNTVNVYGSLAGWELRTTDKLQHLAILSANYDYIRNEAFFYGGQSVRLNLFSEYKLTSGIKVNTMFGGGPILLGAVPEDYTFKGRNYDYTMGAGLSGGAGFNIADKFFYSIDYRGGWLKTVNGNTSHYFLNTVNSEVRYAFNKSISLAAAQGYFGLKAHYKDHQDITSKYPFVRLSARYTVDL